MSFINEDQIKWDELSPSLKARFNNIIARISDLRTKINKTHPGKDKTLSNLFISNPMDGQVLKINSKTNTIFADDNFRNIKIVENDTELAEEMDYKPISLANVFSSWYRYAHYSKKSRYAINGFSPEIEGFVWNGKTSWQNEGFGGRYLNIWSYDSSSKRIINNVDYSPSCGFISPKDYYTNYYLKLRYDSGDNDFVFIVVGYMKDSSGVEHTLSIVRSNGDSDIYSWWFFVYDIDNDSQHILIDYSSRVPRSNSGTYTFSAKRTNSSFEFKTSDTNGVENEAYTMRWSYPSTKPSNMTQAEYDNIGVMLLKENRVGVGSANMLVSFLIEKQYEIFDDGDIYALHTDQVWRYNESSGTWGVIGNIRDILPDRIFLFNSRKNKFYFRNYWGKWTKISSTD